MMDNKILMAQVLNLFVVACVEFARLFDPTGERIDSKALCAAVPVVLCSVVADELGITFEEVQAGYIERLAMEAKGEI